jgi:hypothetical protein
MTQPEQQLHQQILRRQEPFYAVALLAPAIEDENRGCPLHTVAGPETLVFVTLLTHVHANRDEVPLDELRDPRIWIYLGIQPSAAGSHRGRAEVQQHTTLPGARRVEPSFEFTFPGYRTSLHSHG